MNIIFNFFNNILGSIFNLTGDWGIAIILLTILVRIILFPFSIKQKSEMYNQQRISQKIQDIKTKYKNNEKKVKEETVKYEQELAKSTLGCLVTFIQLPVLFTLYNVVMKMPVQVGTIILPWVSSIKMHDSYYIIPIIYGLVSICPQLITNLDYFKVLKEVKLSKTNLIITSIFSILITIKAPIALGLYFITTSLFTLFEEIGYRFYIKKFNVLSSNS
ncbi:YidC/Oxa1 family membrane protein insertase [Clostridium sp. P21]|uniref:YidC/Oxa1 family membrane protein insertase n=1 Tax=Clostridium muellerianum TaxID=2716538 RepID=A0A7Y0HPW1_9CLOT|nr:YidC/Oxa1 family membrane protein insertase [Clostridium muellerianum]NMM64620.1 YidC/Oxa1 family membrane protein insertase [Clostridium muellerianum]